ncbi:MAG TPA: GAF domain-containing protein, partial [Dehalococcoidia bacterium]|nr:GAF domain-containing protein [Dehalococcoidia bacterium]
MARQQASAADEPPIAPAARRARRLIRFVREVDPRLFDALLALVLGAAGLATILGRSDGTADFRSDDLLGAVLVLGQTLPLALRRLSPMGVLAFVNAALVAHAAMGYEVVQAGTFGSLVSVYGAASVSSGRGTGLVAGVVAAGLVGFFATSRGDWSATDVAATSGTWAVAWFAGTFIRMNSRLYEESQRRARDLQTILEMSRAVTSTLDLRQLYETALDRLGELIPYTGAAIQLVTDEGPRQVATRRPPAAGPGGLSAPRFYETRIWRRLWSGEHVVIPDVRGDEPFAVEYRSIIEGDITRSPMSYFRSWMAVPLMLKDRSLGSLSLVHAEPGFFRPEHVELASTV